MTPKQEISMLKEMLAELQRRYDLVVAENENLKRLT